MAEGAFVRLVGNRVRCRLPGQHNDRNNPASLTDRYFTADCIALTVAILVPLPVETSSVPHQQFGHIE
jgi:hypothetical protein